MVIYISKLYIYNNASSRSKVFRKIDLGKKLLKTKSNVKSRMKLVTHHHQEIIE